MTCPGCLSINCDSCNCKSEKRYTVMVETKYSESHYEYSPRFIIRGFYTKDIQTAEAMGLKIEKLLNES